MKKIKKLYERFKKWSFLNQFFFICAIIGLLSFLITYSPYVINLFKPQPDIEVYMVRTYWQQNPNEQRGLIPDNNVRYSLVNNSDQLTLNIFGYHEKREFDRLDQYPWINIGGMGCDLCYYYFIFIKNYGEDYEGDMVLDLSTSTLDIEELPDRAPGVIFDKAGFPTNRKILVKYNGLLKKDDLKGVIRFRTNNSEEIKLQNCEIEGKGKCKFYNAENRIFIVTDNVNSICFEDTGTINIPKLEYPRPYVIWNKTKYFYADIVSSCKDI